MIDPKMIPKDPPAKKSSSMRISCGVLRFFTVIICVILFIANTWMIVDSFVKKTKTIKTSWDQVQEFESPSFVICRQDPFIDLNKNMTSLNEYLDNTYDAEDLARQVGYASSGSEDTNFNRSHWEFKTIYTIFRGRCRVFSYKSQVRTLLTDQSRICKICSAFQVEAQAWILFGIRDSESHDFWILRQGFEALLHLEVWPIEFSSPISIPDGLPFFSISIHEVISKSVDNVQQNYDKFFGKIDIFETSLSDDRNEILAIQTV